jgi:hypothetical protein
MYIYECIIISKTVNFNRLENSGVIDFVKLFKRQTYEKVKKANKIASNSNDIAVNTTLLP